MNSGVTLLKNLALAAALGVAALTATISESDAQGRTALGGAWSGGGVMVTPSGEREQASCRATFQSQGGSSYAMSAVCATASVRVAQTAQIARTGGNNFSGSFYNSEYNISGTISLRVSGNRLNAHLSGGGASAIFSLSRR